jgi:hypothetical protein
MNKIEVVKSNVHPFAVEELACQILGVDYDEIDADTSIIEEELYNEFGIDLDIFGDIISRLLPLVDVGTSPLTEEKYKGFSNGNIWLIKALY